MRSIWNGAISFGLVSIPIKVVNATENHNVSFRQIHTEDGGRIRYRKVCELEDREVTQSEIGKGYEDVDGSIIPISEEELSALPLSTAKTIEIVAFVPADRIDPLQMDAAYYLAANGAPATKPYTLLREALKRSRKVAVAKFALRGRERLGMLRVVDDVIAMHGLLWPDEIRTTEGVAPDAEVTVREAELDLADALMDTLGEVDLASLHDEYREAVEELIAAKAGGEALAPAPAAERKGGKVIDLMSALQSSVRAAQEARGEGGGGSAAEMAEVRRLPRESGGGSATARRSAPARPKEVGGKKSTSTAKKAAKKTPAKKSTAKAGSGTTAAKKTAQSGSSASRQGAKKTAGKTAAKSAAGTKSAARQPAKSSASAKSTAKKTSSRRKAS
ncbi:Ku protein [Streptomyces albus]|uniref:Non-homologous end joining protein Ku n=1 Tax=Streptomyces albus (strain ATCC 21838 / DSM 41398 / FERM P-419 / JCM 4703 / NBRC 107858) TaxID=1081613 RepID=A0A0B5ESZ0_STRA4|nr:Ku protein [Streptomyces albus]AOU76675.1 Ku protein [Streptomyces albus]AYN32454.1 Ku protein [Streptomyces albus]